MCVVSASVLTGWGKAWGDIGALEAQLPEPRVLQQ